MDTERTLMRKIGFIIRHFADFKELDSASQMRLLSKGDVTIALVDKSAGRYDQLLADLLRFHNWSDKFSEKYVENELQTLLAKVAKEEIDARAVEDRVEHYFKELVNQLDSYSVEHIVSVPLTGFDVRVAFEERVDIGNLTLMYMSDDRIRELVEVYEAIRTTAPRSAPAQEKLTNAISKRNFSRIGGHVCAEFRVIAEPARATERAYDEVRRVVDWLRYALSLLHSNRDQCKKMAAGLGLLGEVIVRTPEMTVAVSSPLGGMTFQNTTKGPLIPFGWTAENVGFLRDSGLVSMAALLKSSELTDFQQAIILGVHWFADSLTQIERENELLSLITCLESVVRGKDKENKRTTETSIRRTIAERVATVYATTLPPDQKKSRDTMRGQMENFILKMYTKRSTITHGGKIEILERELQELGFLVQGLLKWLIEQHQSARFANQEMFFKWIQCNKSKFEHERLEKELGAKAVIRSITET